MPADSESDQQRYRVTFDSALFRAFVRTISGFGGELGRFTCSMNNGRTFSITGVDFSISLGAEGDWGRSVSVAGLDLIKAAHFAPQTSKMTVEIEGNTVRIGGVAMAFERV